VALLLLWIPKLNIEMKNKVALIGGTFDPVHVGHINLFHNAYSLAGFSSLIVIPALISNFKQGTHPVSFSSRVEMLGLAIEDYRELYPDDKMEIIVSTIEGEKGGISYTSDTIRSFYPKLEDNGKINFIIGDDILPDLNKWHDFEYIRTHVRFYCFEREGKRADYGVEVHFIPSSVTVASSSAIRFGAEGMLSRRVKEYINEHKLYRAL